MKINLGWLVPNGIFAWLLWFGLVEGNTTAASFAIAIVWFTFVIALLSTRGVAYVAMRMKYAAQKKAGIATPRWLDMLFDVGVIGVLMSTGWIISGLAYAVHTGCLSFTLRGIKENQNA